MTSRPSVMAPVTCGAVIAVCLSVASCRVCPPKLPTAGSVCRSDADCAAPLSCRDFDASLAPELRWNEKHCTRSCRSGGECGGGDCVDNWCRPPSPDTQRDLILVVPEDPAPFEVAPWIQFGGGVRLDQESRLMRSIGTGVEGTFSLGCTSGQACRYRHARIGPWLGLDNTNDRTRGEAGVALNLGSPAAIAFSTFGFRAGAGHATTGETHLVGQVSWGTRFVSMRRHGFETTPCPAVIAPASGLRLFLATRRELEGTNRFEVTFGVEWQPSGERLGIIGN